MTNYPEVASQLIVAESEDRVYSLGMSRTDQILGSLKADFKVLRDEFDDFVKKSKLPKDKWWDQARKRPFKTILKVLGYIVTLGAFLTLIFNVGWAVFSSRLDTKFETKLHQPTEDIKALRSDVSAIKGRLDELSPLIHGLLLDRFEKTANLPQKEFEKKLPEIQNLISLAKQEGTSVDPALVHRIGEKLLKIQPRVPEFWKTSAELVSYRSFNNAPQATRQLDVSKLRDCTDSPPEPMKISEVVDEHTIKFSRGLYQDCRVTLDSVQDNDRLNSFLLKQTPLITFKHCLVVYHGGAVNLILAWKNTVETFHIEGHSPLKVSNFSGNAMEFEDCLFTFSIISIPPPTGQQLTETLLAQNSATLKLPHP